MNLNQNPKPHPRRTLRSIPRRLPGLAAAVLSLLLFPSRASAADPCCPIAAVDPTTGVVTARVSATGQVLEFTVDNPALLKNLGEGAAVDVDLASLKVGQPFAADFGALGASLGIEPGGPCCTLRSLSGGAQVVAASKSPTPSPGTPDLAIPSLQTPPPPGPPPPAEAGVSPPQDPRRTRPQKPSRPFAPPDSQRDPRSPGAPEAPGGGVAPGGPCCSITAMDTGSGVVTGVETATGRSFQFRAHGSLLLALRVGLPLAVDWRTGQILASGLSVPFYLLRQPGESPPAPGPAPVAAPPPQDPRKASPQAGKTPWPGGFGDGVETPLPQVPATQTFDPCVFASAQDLQGLIGGGLAGYFPYKASKDGRHITISSPQVTQATCPNLTLTLFAGIRYQVTRGFPQFSTSGDVRLRSPLTARVTYHRNSPLRPVDIVSATACLNDVQVIGLNLDNVPNWLDSTWIQNCLNGHYSDWGCTDVADRMCFDITGLVQLYVQAGGSF